MSTTILDEFNNGDSCVRSLRTTFPLSGNLNCPVTGHLNPQPLGTNMAAIKTAVPAAVAAIGGLFSTEDADAGFLTPGIRGARDKIDYDPSARGNSTLKLGLSKAPDGSGMSTNDRLDTLLSAMDGMGKKKQLQYFTNYIHNKANYESWGSEMLQKDGARSGQAYKDGLDAFLEDIIERRPQLEAVATEYAMAGGGRGRLSRTSNQAQQQEDRRRSNPNRRRASLGVGTPAMGDDFLQAQYHNHEMAVDQNMRDIGVSAKDPMYEYGSLLPIRSNIVTGEREMAMPDFGRDILRGLFSLGNTPKTGIYDPKAAMDVFL